MTDNKFRLGKVNGNYLSDKDVLNIFKDLSNERDVIFTVNGRDHLEKRFLSVNYKDVYKMILKAKLRAIASVKIDDMYDDLSQKRYNADSNYHESVLTPIYKEECVFGDLVAYSVGDNEAVYITIIKIVNELDLEREARETNYVSSVSITTEDNEDVDYVLNLLEDKINAFEQYMDMNKLDDLIINGIEEV